MATEYLNFRLNGGIIKQAIALDIKSKYKKQQKELDSTIESCLNSVGEEVVDYAKSNHSYKDRSGNLTESVHYTVDKNRLRVFIDTRTAPYAKYVVYGTRPHRIEPVNAKSLKFGVDNFIRKRDKMGRFTKKVEIVKKDVYSKYVNHPGSKPHDFLTKAFNAKHSFIIKLFKRNLKDFDLR